MIVLARLLLLMVALEHLGLLVFQTFLWQSPLALQLFHQTAAQAADSAVLAANQGVHNGLLAIGLLVGLVGKDRRFCLFFLGFAIVVGMFAALTSDGRVFFLQTVPAMVALLLFLQDRKGTKAHTKN